MSNRSNPSNPTNRLASRSLSTYTASAIVIAILLSAAPASAQSPSQPPAAQYAGLGKKIQGAATCNTANCHGATQAGPVDSRPGNEYATWANTDPHRWAFDSLSEPLDEKFKARYAEIAKKLSIADAKTSDTCLRCHALKVPAALRADKFDLAEAVTCASCHGPSDAWFKPHEGKGWFDKTRTEAGYDTTDAAKSIQRTDSAPHAKLLKDLGFFDTRPLLARAEKCTACHLGMEPKLVEAGHPQPIFELAHFSRFENFQSQFGADVKLANHWRDRPGVFAAQLWAAGQVVGLRDAMLQLADRAGADSKDASDQSIKDAYQQAMSHLIAFNHLLKTGKVSPADADKLTALSAKLAPAAQGKKDPAAAQAARDIAASAAGLMDATIKFAATPDSARAILAAIAKDATMSAIAGHHGASQQAMAIASLSRAAGGTPAQAKLIADKLLKVLRMHDDFKPADFAKDLAEVAGQVAQ